jgi:hypothetical protein
MSIFPEISSDNKAHHHKSGCHCRIRSSQQATARYFNNGLEVIALGLPKYGLHGFPYKILF